MMQKVDIIIPVYRPDQRFLELLDRLEHQTQPVNQIILMNTEKRYFDELAGRSDMNQKYKNMTVCHIAKKDFDHAKTRNEGVRISEAPFFVMMTDDALPDDDRLLEHLLAPFEDPKVGISYARQLPDRDSGAIERYTRAFNYPEEPVVKSSEDLKRMGIKAFFASNVCAAYKREIFDHLQGFVSPAIFNEDMVYARKLIDAGYKIAYAAGAKVVHSHNYSGMEQLRRNFDLGVSHADHPRIFSDLATESEGVRLVKATAGYLCRQKKPWLLFKLIWNSGCKYIGYFLGKRYRGLPSAMVKRCSMNREYWEQAH